MPATAHLNKRMYELDERRRAFAEQKTRRDPPLRSPVILAGKSTILNRPGREDCFTPLFTHSGQTTLRQTFAPLMNAAGVSANCRNTMTSPERAETAQQAESPTLYSCLASIGKSDRYSPTPQPRIFFPTPSPERQEQSIDNPESSEQKPSGSDNEQ